MWSYFVYFDFWFANSSVLVSSSVCCKSINLIVSFWCAIFHENTKCCFINLHLETFEQEHKVLWWFIKLFSLCAPIICIESDKNDISQKLVKYECVFLMITIFFWNVDEYKLFNKKWKCKNPSDMNIIAIKVIQWRSWRKRKRNLKKEICTYWKFKA